MNFFSDIEFFFVLIATLLEHGLPSDSHQIYMLFVMTLSACLQSYEKIKLDKLGLIISVVITKIICLAIAFYLILDIKYLYFLRETDKNFYIIPYNKITFLILKENLLKSQIFLAIFIYQIILIITLIVLIFKKNHQAKN